MTLRDDIAGDIDYEVDLAIQRTLEGRISRGAAVELATNHILDHTINFIRKRQNEIANLVAPYTFNDVEVWTGAHYAKAVVEYLCGKETDE
jgi:hypothetical protein